MMMTRACYGLENRKLNDNKGEAAPLQMRPQYWGNDGSSRLLPGIVRFFHGRPTLLEVCSPWTNSSERREVLGQKASMESWR